MGNSACSPNLGNCCHPSRHNEGNFLSVVKFPDHSDGGSGLLCCMESKPQSREWADSRRTTESRFFFDDSGSYETALIYESQRQRHGNSSASAMEQNPTPPLCCSPLGFHHTADPPALNYTATRAMQHGSNPAWPAPAAAATTKPLEPLVSRS
jgi:hypothetical protein